jgi:hypothetical protein
MSLRAAGAPVTAIAALFAAPILQACGGGAVVTTGDPAYSVSVRTQEQEIQGIPPGHMPPPGGCRIWFPGEPPGHQPPPGRCEELIQSVPADAWLLHRPSQEKRVFRIA